MTRNIRIPLPAGQRSVAAYQPDMSRALGEWSATCNRLNDLDPILLEVVRIRCARTHDCRLCKASRLLAAGEEGVDETMLASVDFYEQSSLPERLKVALRFTDAFVTRPGDISPELRRDLHDHFTEREIVVLSLKIATFSIQKQLIALGLDVLPDMEMEREIAWFEYDDHGGISYVGTPRRRDAPIVRS
jgi:alkylhydroperoxidase family enzyme